MGASACEAGIDPRSVARAPGAALALACITLVAWAPALASTFHFDDWASVVGDEATSDATALGARLSHGIRPLLRVSYFLDHAAWGMRPAGFLATNLGLHVATVLAVHALARRRLASGAGAFLCGAIFALQPAHAEVIAYVSGRSTGLMSALLLAGVLAHERAAEAGGRAGTIVRLASLSSLAAACLAKEVAIVFPLLLLLWDGTRASAPPRPRAALWASAGAAAAVAAALAASPRYRELASYSLGLRSPAESLAANARAVPEMLSLWVRPWSLSVDHAFEPVGSPSATLAGAAALAALAVVAVASRRRWPLLSLAIGWALLSLAPTNSVVAKIDLVTEKPLYLAWFGPSLLLGQLAARLPGPAPSARARRAFAAALAAALPLAAGACAWRASLWSDPRLLWRDAVAKAPCAARAWNNLGSAHWQMGCRRAAREAFLRALRLDPADRTARRNLWRLDVLGARHEEEPCEPARSSFSWLSPRPRPGEEPAVPVTSCAGSWTG